MSSASSPTHRVTNGFDGTSYYDPDFTVEISNRMRVPDKISILPDGQDNHNERNGYPKTNESNEWMRVPERILVAGGDKYAAGRPAPPEMKLESSIHGENLINEHVQLMTPPRHLTLNEHSYPTVEPENDLNLSDSELKSSNRHVKTINFSQQDINYGSPTQDTFGNSFLNSNNSMSAEGELGQLKRNVKLLSRKVNALERETAQRYQRDVLIYTLGIIYFVFKGFSWLNRRW